MAHSIIYSRAWYLTQSVLLIELPRDSQVVQGPKTSWSCTIKTTISRWYNHQIDYNIFVFSELLAAFSPFDNSDIGQHVGGRTFDQASWWETHCQVFRSMNLWTRDYLAGHQRPLNTRVIAIQGWVYSSHHDVWFQFAQVSLSLRH